MMNMEMRTSIQELQEQLLASSDNSMSPVERKKLVHEFLISREDEIAKARRDYHAVAQDVQQLQEKSMVNLNSNGDPPPLRSRSSSPSRNRSSSPSTNRSIMTDKRDGKAATKKNKKVTLAEARSPRSDSIDDHRAMLNEADALVPANVKKAHKKALVLSSNMTADVAHNVLLFEMRRLSKSFQVLTKERDYVSEQVCAYCIV